MSAIIPPITDMAFLMLLSAMYIELIVAIESFFAKSTFGVTFESTLIYGTRIVVSKSFVFPEFTKGEEFVLMCEYLLVSGTKITQCKLAKLM